MSKNATRTVPGIDIFLKQKKYMRAAIGLITGPSGITSSGVSTWKALSSAGYSLAALFGPEHGLRGEAQDAEKIEDSTSESTKVFSLYGTRLRPTKESLKELDLVVYDIQNVGCRYYTYLYTLAYCMEECAKIGKSFIVLDRPNPICADTVEGGPIAEEAASFVGGYGLPARYGLTVGEYAEYLKGEYIGDMDLQVIRMKGYLRNMYHSDTGLPWVSPSPNIPTSVTTLVYPGTCLFEGTNLSEGRGTTRPFETVGAPWIDGEAWREALNALRVRGVLFTSTFFRPAFSKHSGKSCQGVVVHVTDRKAFKPLYTALAMLWILKRDYPKDFAWKDDWDGGGSFVDRLAGGSYLRSMIDSGAELDEIYERATAGRNDFLKIRRKYLLYDH